MLAYQPSSSPKLRLFAVVPEGFHHSYSQLRLALDHNYRSLNSDLQQRSSVLCTKNDDLTCEAELQVFFNATKAKLPGLLRICTVVGSGSPPATRAAIP